MSRHNRPFKFKRFEVNHSHSSMKIGVDAVILGAWADFKSARTILDVGCGCGVIALMAAQRNASAHIEAIDIDAASVEESTLNFALSPWSERLAARQIDFNDYCKAKRGQGINGIDYIVSNPPFFSSGIDDPESVRLVARHQAALSPKVILKSGADLLSECGKIGMVVPFEQCEELRDVAKESGLQACRTLIMTGREGREPKRGFMEFSRAVGEEKIETLSIERPDGSFTSEYISLCRDFYLKF